jgi:hypothetical protein
MGEPQRGFTRCCCNNQQEEQAMKIKTKVRAGRDCGGGPIVIGGDI